VELVVPVVVPFVVELALPELELPVVPPEVVAPTTVVDEPLAVSLP
jgi:hypothetical protein